MRAENAIVMRAPLEKIFETAADLSLWPKILPRYRWVRYIEKSPTKSVVQMAAKRTWIPVQWISIQEIDRERMQVRFRHVKAFTKGMEVVWTFTATDVASSQREIFPRSWATRSRPRLALGEPNLFACAPISMAR
jgi:ribosome-associated toxin RatA of RatAB toxin-antitoxin module